MNPVLTFSIGVVLLLLFGWYTITDIAKRKRTAGTLFILLLTVFCAVTFRNEGIQKGLDLEGGTSYLLELKAEKDEATGETRKITPQMRDQAIEVIRKRVDQYGVREPIIAAQGDNRILVQIAGIEGEKAAEAREQLQKVAKLEFKMVHPESESLVPAIENQTAIRPPEYEIVKYSEERENGKKIDQKLLIKKRADLPGKMVAYAGVTIGQSGEYEISLKFTSEGADLFGKLTAANVGRRFAIVLDGEVKSAPVIREAIYGGSASISGNFSQTEAFNLASVLNNPLETPVEIVEERSASASLGADSINSGLRSGIYGVIATVLCVLVYYRFAGLVANVALMANVIILFGAMAMFNTTLTLPGIAGIILTLGMAIDANVLIYERLREEMAAGKSFRGALDAAYDKAFSAIFDSNVTTLITAAILFWKASGPVKGFAATLTMGVIASMFSALIFTRVLFAWAIDLGLIKTVTMSRLIKPTNINFLGKRRIALALSLAVILGSCAIFAYRGEKNFGLDFVGGDRLVLEAKNKPSDGEVRKALEPLGLSDFSVQTERSAAKEFTAIRSPGDTSKAISKHLMETMPQAGFTEVQSEHVGGLVGAELARGSLIALGLGILGILIYVSVRFEFSFALGALVALVHDVVITIGIFSLLGREMNLVIVGAILTIAGYSVNDTIVVFDRIRENLKSGRKGSIADIMNQSVNETLSRTLLTGGITLITTALLFVFGGPVLADFALAILVGILVGTYSSVYIASPIVLWWSGRKGSSLEAEIRRSQAASANA